MPEFNHLKIIDHWGLGWCARVEYTVDPESQQRLAKAFVIEFTFCSHLFEFALRW